MATVLEMVEFVRDLTGNDKIREHTDILDSGCVGDDFHELIEKFSDRYHGDMNAYLWYFHGDEEGFNIGGLFYKPPYDQVKRIPVTPALLAEISGVGRWNIEYPDHVISSKHNDIIARLIFVATVFLSLFYYLLR
ncbi:hypothetical protein DSL64_22915 [Dyadobacter luteus]|uniref:DUF1493 domain-containing protein n=1 Tax=Dyadobacter luteus TaxID=2259619 RepID=A0A3D8Y5J9_9BACT|nr:DUF1493 family protein [Dyadobacter luteus]REA57789.1 hypothetical protein DSL64_22915 [Dyadobacter luteus]